jgi:hypothetical protein
MTGGETVPGMYRGPIHFDTLRIDAYYKLSVPVESRDAREAVTIQLIPG